MTLNEIFGEPRTLCGWLVDKNLVRLQIRDPRFREAIQHLNRDTRSLCIAMASIVAKVTRDRVSRGPDECRGP
jgi:ribonuclease HII